MTEEHVEVDQVREEQASLSSVAQSCSMRSMPSRFEAVGNDCVDAAAREDVADFSDADDAGASSRCSTVRGGMIEKSCRRLVRRKFPVSPTNGRAMTRPIR